MKEQRKMNNEKKENKSMKMRLNTLFFLLFFLYFSSCSDSISMPKPDSYTPPEGMGALVLNIGGIGRTILPDLGNVSLHGDIEYHIVIYNHNEDYNVYSEFIKNNELPDGRLTYDLSWGRYTLYVYASVHNSGSSYLFASAVYDFTVKAGDVINKTIYLKPEPSVNSYEGTFSWDISSENNLIESINIKIFDYGNPTIKIESNNLNSSVTLPAGYYTVVFEITCVNVSSVIWQETLHVYNFLTSHFEMTFTEDYINKDIYTITIDYGIDGIPPVLRSFFDGYVLNLSDFADLAEGGFALSGWKINDSSNTYNSIVVNSSIEKITLIWGKALMMLHTIDYLNSSELPQAQVLSPINKAQINVQIYGFETDFDIDNFIDELSGDNIIEIVADNGALGGIEGLDITTTTIINQNTLDSIIGKINIELEENAVFSNNEAEIKFKIINLPDDYIINSNLSVNGIFSLYLNVKDGAEDYDPNLRPDSVDRRIPIFQDNIMEFNSYANSVAGIDKHYILLQDVTLSIPAENISNWIPIGEFSLPAGDSSWQKFKGSFNGNNRKIINLIINNTNVKRGFFLEIDEDGKVFDLILEDVTIFGGTNAGAIAGINNGSIINCHVIGNSEINGNDQVGGITGSNSGKIEKCSNSGEITGKDYIGGISGQNNKEIINCYNTGKITGNSYIGGISGSVYANQQNIKILNCYNTGNVEGKDYVAGIVGYVDGTVYLIQIHNNIALNTNIVDTNNGTFRGNFYRIANNTSSGTPSPLQDNYARSDMLVKNTLITSLNSNEAGDGMYIVLGDSNATYSIVFGGWDCGTGDDPVANSVWVYPAGYYSGTPLNSGTLLPTLRNMPSGAIQNPEIPVSLFPDKAEFYGTWVRNQGFYSPYIIKIDENSFYFADIDEKQNHDTIEFDNIVWTLATNTATSSGILNYDAIEGVFDFTAGKTPKEEFPVGYTITGTRSATSISQYINALPNGFFIALSDNKNTLYIGKSASDYSVAGFKVEDISNNSDMVDSIFTRVSVP